MASNENHKGVIVIDFTAIAPFCFSNRFYVGVLLKTCIAPMVSSQTPHWLKGGLIKVKTSDIMRIIFCFLSNMVKSCIDHPSINVSLGKTFSMIFISNFPCVERLRDFALTYFDTMVQMLRDHHFPRRPLKHLRPSYIQYHTGMYRLYHSLFVIPQCSLSPGSITQKETRVANMWQLKRMIK